MDKSRHKRNIFIFLIKKYGERERKKRESVACEQKNNFTFKPNQSEI